jgi:hypothetical protein
MLIGFLLPIKNEKIQIASHKMILEFLNQSSINLETTCINTVTVSFKLSEYTIQICNN